MDGIPRKVAAGAFGLAQEVLQQCDLHSRAGGTSKLPSGAQSARTGEASHQITQEIIRLKALKTSLEQTFPTTQD